MKKNPVLRSIIFLLLITVSLFLFTPPALAQIANVTSSATFTAESASWDYFGYAVASGDVNHDGYTDLIIGAYYYPNPNLIGRVYIFYGSSSGISTKGAGSANVILTGEAAANDFGISVASADVNNDGFDDVIVGAKRAIGSKGRAYVFLGSAAGISSKNASAANTILTGETASDWFGWSVASAGDINHDGYDDIVVGAYTYNAGSDKGRAYVFLGSASGIATKPAASANAILTGENDDDYFGYAVASAGDVNKDGYDDVVVGAYGYVTDDKQGRAYIFYGSSSGISTKGAASANAILTGEASNDSFGEAVLGVDVNNDGYSDVVVGAERGGGRAYIFYGSSSGISTKGAASANAILRAQGDSGSFGYSLASAGDINNDGYNDLLVGAYGYDGGAGLFQGRIYIFFSSSSGISSKNASLADVMATGESASDNFGLAISSAGDTNNDGWKEFLVGARNVSTSAGKAYLYNINPSASLRVNPMTYTNDRTPDVSGTGSFANTNVSGIQFNFETSYGSGWRSCTSQDGVFDSKSENYTCNLHGGSTSLTMNSDLKEGWHTAWIRSYDSNSVYIPSTLFAKDNFLVDITNPGPFEILSPEKNEVLTTNQPLNTLPNQPLNQPDYCKTNYCYTNYPYSTKNPNLDPSRPTFRWYANSRDTEVNTNGKTDEGSGIDKYSLEVFQNTSEVSVPEEWERVFKIDEIPFNISTKDHYHFLNDDKYTLVYEGFEDDLRDGLGTPNPYNYDNNYLSLTTRDCVSTLKQHKDCWKEGENNGMLTDGSTHGSTPTGKIKYKLVIRATDRAGNSRIEERTFNYQPNSVPGTSSLGGTTVLGEKEEDIKILDIKKLREEENRLQDYQRKTIKPLTLIFLGSLLLGISFLVWKKRKVN